MVYFGSELEELQSIEMETLLSRIFLVMMEKSQQQEQKVLAHIVSTVK